MIVDLLKYKETEEFKKLSAEEQAKIEKMLNINYGNNKVDPKTNQPLRYKFTNYLFLENELTDDDIEKINNTDNCVVVFNSAGRDKLGKAGAKKVNIAPAQLAKITNKGALFSNTTSYDYVNQEKFNVTDHIDTTFHSAQDLGWIYSHLDNIASAVKDDASLNDLDKAMYGFLKLGEILQYEHEYRDPKHERDEYTGRDFLRSLACVLNHQYGKKSVCAGISVAYVELMRRMGIDCEYVEKVGDHAWVNLIFKDKKGNVKKIPVDPTWAMNAIENQNCKMRDVLFHFGLNPDFYEPDKIDGKNHHGIDKEERVLDSNGKAVTLPVDTVKASYQKISKKLYSKEVKMIKNTAVTEQGEMYFAVHPDIATRGLGFTGYILHLKRPDGTTEMKLIYADNDIDMSKITYEEINDALDNKHGYLGAEGASNKARQTYEELCDESKNDELFTRTDIKDGESTIAMSIGTGTRYDAYTDVGTSDGDMVLRVNKVSATLINSLTPEQLTELAKNGDVPSNNMQTMEVEAADVKAM